MWDDTNYDDTFAPEPGWPEETDGFEESLYREEQQSPSRSRQEDRYAREREEWTRFVLEINNVIPGPLNDPRLFEDNDSMW